VLHRQWTELVGVALASLVEGELGFQGPLESEFVGYFGLHPL